MQRLLSCFFEFWGGFRSPELLHHIRADLLLPVPSVNSFARSAASLFTGPRTTRISEIPDVRGSKKTSLPFWISIRPTPRLSGRAPRGGNWGDPEKKEPIGGRSRAKRGGVADFGANNRNFGNDPSRPTLTADTWCAKTKYPFPPKESTFSGDPARS